MEQPTLGDLFVRACAGDRDAARELFERLAPAVWAWVGRHRLGQAASEDVVQVVWMKLFENCDNLRDPRRVAGWLRVTANNECNAVHRRRQAERLAMQRAETDQPLDGPELDVVDQITDAQMLERVRAAFRSLDDRCRKLLELLTRVPALPYEEVAAEAGMPVGSIGPTRARCLDKLRTRLEH